MYCPNCGEEIDDNAIVCPHCGVATAKFYRQNSQRPQVVVNNAIANTNVNGGMISPKSKMATLVLAILLGAFGIHRFYVGKIGTGLIWMFTAGLGGFGWLIDIIMILTGHFRDKRGFVIVR